jgi:hypothetical protein
MSWDKNPPLEPVFALDTLRNRVNTILKSNQKRTNTQEGDYQVLIFLYYRVRCSNRSATAAAGTAMVGAATQACSFEEHRVSERLWNGISLV